MDTIYQKNPNINDKCGKQTNKRAMQSEESAFNKKMKISDTRLNKRSLNICKPENKRNTTFANDRLKRLRNNISSEVIPFSNTISPSVLKSNICSTAYIPRKRPESKQTNLCSSSLNLFEGMSTLQSNDLMNKSSRTNQQFDNTSYSTSEDQIHHQSFSENHTLTGKDVHHTSDLEDPIQLNVDPKTSKGADPVLSPCLDDKYQLLQRKVPIKISHKIRRELRNTSFEKDSNLINFVKNKDCGKLEERNEKSEIIVNIGESSSRNISPMKFPRRIVGSQDSSLNISITSSCSETENSKSKITSSSDDLKVETKVSMYSPIEKSSFGYISESKSTKNHDNLEIGKNSVNSRLLHLRADISENKMGIKNKSNNSDSSFVTCISNTYVQQPLKRNSFSSVQMTNKCNITESPSKKSTLNVSYDTATNSMTNKMTQCDSSEKESQKNNSLEVNVNPIKDCSKYWINYNQLIDSLYEKYFGTEKDKNKISTCYKDNFPEAARSETSSQVGQPANDEDASMDWDDDDVIDDVGEISNPSPKGEQNCLKQEMYIVVDTNIFLSDLNILKEIVACGSNGKTKCILYVPWMVLTELDFMKDDKNTEPHLRKKVTDAVNFINKTLLGGGRKLIGQNIFEAERQKYIGKAPDDKIVSCCLQAKLNNLNVLLLSNDVNLKNKLLFNGIPALSTAEMVKNPAISSSNDNSAIENKIDDKLQKINETMSSCCSYIICECARYAYGKVWNKMDMLKNPPPWTLSVCLKIFEKYWSSVFRERLLKHCLRTVEQLAILLKSLEYSRNKEQFDEFVQECLSLCIFLKDLEEHKDFVKSTIEDINSITNL